MAEFQVVMEQWKRRCKHCTDDYSDCNIHSIVCDGFCKMKNFADFMSVEKEVMAWTEENPEPIYPTWGDWLCSQKVVGVHALQAPSSNVYYPIEGKMNTPIPADIAQKLGLEAKPKPIDYCREAYRDDVTGELRIRKTPIYPIEPKET